MSWNLQLQSAGSEVKRIHMFFWAVQLLHQKIQSQFFEVQSFVSQFNSIEPEGEKFGSGQRV